MTTTEITSYTANERRDIASDKFSDAYRSYLADMQVLTAALGDVLNADAEEEDPIGILYGAMNHIVTMMIASLRKFEQDPDPDSGKALLKIVETLIENLDDTSKIFVLSPTHAMMFAGVSHGLNELGITYNSDLLNIARAEGYAKN